MPSEKRHLLSHLAKRSWKVGEFIIITKSEWDLVSLVFDMTANSAQQFQLFPSVYSILVIVDFIEQN